jgi:filamentous hemagglutinin
MVIGDGATLTGAGGMAAGSITLDSTYATSLASSAVLNATSVNLDSGQISLELSPPTTAPTTTGLVLSNSALSNLQAAAQTLSLLSYSSIDIYGSGDIGAPAVLGVYPVGNLALHTAEIRGFNDAGGGGTVTINANNVTLDNSPNGAVGVIQTGLEGNLTINAATIELGTNQLHIDQFANVLLNTSSGIILDAETKVINPGYFYNDRHGRHCRLK